MHRCAPVPLVALVLSHAALAGTWADHVVSYQPGANPAFGMTDPATALGEPARFTGEGDFTGAVTPFNPPWIPTQLVSLGQGGSLVVSFDQPITNEPAHPFGLDLLIFGNSGYTDLNYPHGITNGVLFGPGHGRIELSANGSDWFTVPGVEADAAYPTLGYSDLTDPYSHSAGAAPSDFTKPVNPAFNAAGMNFAQIVAAYAGSGGGTGVDIASVGLSSVSFVRITNPSSTGTVELDAFSRVGAVPAPSAIVLALGLVAFARRRHSLTTPHSMP
jgi:hypothetical protein